MELETITLDTLCKKNKYPHPDIVKIDVQGAEIDIIKGATETLKDTKYLILELQHKELNIGAPLADQAIIYLESIGWKLISNYNKNVDLGGVDGDYLFINES